MHRRSIDYHNLQREELREELGEERMGSYLDITLPLVHRI
jgi:hypothetical protein